MIARLKSAGTAYLRYLAFLALLLTVFLAGFATMYVTALRVCTAAVR
jgi:hypothetical protein